MTEVTPIPKGKKRSTKSPLRRCDSLFSKLIRARGRCEHCGTTMDLQCAHGFSRRYRAVRWDVRNAFALCSGDHMYFTIRPLEWDDWLRDRWGTELYDELRALALHAPNPRLADVLIELRRLGGQGGVAA